MPWRGPEYPGEFPSLGWQVLDWAQAYFRVPDGPLGGMPLTLTDEQLVILVRFYQLDDAGRFVFRRAAVRRAQGWGKSPLLAVVALAELAGPAKFDGWDAAGEPVGIPTPTPWVQVAANSEDQAGNTYNALYEMAARSELNGTVLDVGKTNVLLSGEAGSGRLEPVSASAGTRLGQRVTFAVLDEALALDTPLPTPDGGWTTMGAVRVGDLLLDRYGKPTRVVKKTPPQVRPSWRVCFEDGTSVVASGGHLWLSKFVSVTAPPLVRTTEQMANAKCNFRVPVGKGHDGEEQDFDIDPYMLGYWLGDGESNNACISVGRQDAPAVLDLIQERGYTTTYRDDGINTPYIYVSLPGSYAGIRGTQRSPVRGLAVRLRENNLLLNKHVPEQYFRASRAQRHELLCGLMDSDGYASKDGDCSFANTNQQLIADVVRLLRSLGEVCTVVWSRSSACWYVNFTTRNIDPPFHLRRKAERVKKHARGPEWVTIKRFEPVGGVEVSCVAVEAADHLFQAGEGCHVTHNTHSWTKTNGGIKLANVIRRNAAKMNGRTFESTNAHEPGEDSVAERTYEAAKRGAPGLLYDSVEAPWVEDLSDSEAVIAALKVAYGDSSWVDLERIAMDIADPATDPEDARRFFFNQLVKGTGRPVDIEHWRTLADVDREVPRGAYIGVGFDGSINDDSTCLYGCTEDGHIFEIQTWEKPEGAAGEDWHVPRRDVNEKVKWVFQNYRVGRMLCDPPKWWTEIETWAARWPDYKRKPRVLALDTFSARRFAPVCGRLATSAREETITHDGGEGLTAHLAACAKKRVRINDPDDKDDGRAQFVIVKSDTRKIDRAVAAALALEAAMTMERRGSLGRDEEEELSPEELVALLQQELDEDLRIIEEELGVGAED